MFFAKKDTKIKKIFSILLLIILIALSAIFYLKIKEQNSPKKLIPKFSFGRKGEGIQELNIPTSLAIKGNYLYVADAGNNRIQVLKITHGHDKIMPEFSFGERGKELGQFINPCGLYIKDTNLYVADSGNSRIQVFNITSDGKITPKLAFGKPGQELGEFSDYITSLAIKDNYLYVADTGNNRIQVFQIE